MSAIIWCGIVAVWVFVLIPTWVRRGDLHWRRGPIGTAVVAEGPTDKRSGKAGDRVPRRRILRRSRTDMSIEVEAMAEQDAQSPEEDVVYAASAPRARVAAAPSSGRLSSAMRSSFGTGPKGSRKKPPLHVRRARRLVLLAALALGTLIAAIVGGGLMIAVNIIFDIVLIFYVRHLRNAARAKAARAAREKRARAARIAWEEAAAPERSSGLGGWTAPAATEAYAATETYEEVYVDDELQYAEGEYAQVEYAEEEAVYDEEPAADVPGGIDLTAEQPALIDLTDAPTEELIAAQAS